MNDAEPRAWYSFLNLLRQHLDSLEFIYLAPSLVAANAEQCNPYDLDIVSHAEVNPRDFYTMSSAGVTHFVDGSADFTPLDQFEREYHLVQPSVHARRIQALPQVEGI